MKKNCILTGLILVVLFAVVLNRGFVKETKAGNIAGIVVCEGKPLTDVQVSILEKKARTDSNGKFLISNIIPGAYIVAVTGDKCIKSFFKPVLVWPDSTTILILLSDTLPRPALNCKVKGTAEIDSASFVKMDLEYLMKLDLSSAKKEVVPDSARKIIINGDTVIEVRLSRYPEGLIQFDNDQMKITQKKNLGTGNIAGIVLDANSGEPLFGASIYFEGIPEAHIIRDTLGRFWLSSVPEGEYELWAAMITFRKTKVSHLKVAKDLTSMVVFKLSAAPIGKRDVRWREQSWQGEKVKCDSTEFYSNYYKVLLREK